MFRRLCVLVFVLFFVVSEPTFGARLFRHRRTSCPPMACCKSYDQECFCLQARIWNVPFSTIDYYECLHYPDGCGPDDLVEHFTNYVFAPYTDPSELPQTCDGEHPCIGQRLCKTAVPVYTQQSSQFPGCRERGAVERL